MGTHPLLPQLLLQRGQAAFLPQHAAVPPAESKNPNEALERAEVSQRPIRSAAVEGKGEKNKTKQEAIFKLVPRLKRSIISAVLKR